MYGFVPLAANLRPMTSVYPDVRVTGAVDRLRQDVGFSVRLLRQAPGLTAAIVLTLALGIGATAAMFSVVDAVLVRPLDYRDADALVAILHRRTNPVAPANFLDWQRDATGFASIGAAQYWTPALGATTDPEKLFALQVSDEILPMLGVPPALGRFPRPGDAGAREAVIADGLWRRRFGADRDALGRTIVLDGTAFTIVGVMPSSFRFAPFWATRAELWAPLVLGARASSRSGQSLRVFGRLAPGTTIEQARASIAALTAGLEASFPGTNRNVTVTPLKDLVVGDARPAIVVLFAAVWLVLLVACANAAHLLLSRAATRGRELAMRSALGATRARIAAQLLTENLLIAAIAGLAGLVLARGFIGVFKLLGAVSIPRVQAIVLDARVAGFAALLAVVTALVFGLLPALRLSRPDLTTDLADGGRGSTTGRRRRRLHQALIASEVALAVMLLVGAALLVRSFAALGAVDPGFGPDRLVSMVVSVTGTPEGAPGRRVPIYGSLIEHVRATPGVASASAINHVPLVGDLWGMPYQIEGRLEPAPGDAPAAAYRIVLPRYFETIGRPLVEGRDFTDADRDGAAPVVIVSQHLAASQFGGKAIGQRMRVAGGEWRSIVGVARHAVRSNWLDEPADEVYLPLRQAPEYRDDASSRFAGSVSLVVRAAGDPAAILPPLRNAVRAVAPSAPISDVFVMTDVVRDATAGARFVLALLVAFAGIAWVLAAIGVAGVMSAGASARRHEIAVRLALGASRLRIVRTVVGEGLAVTAVGLAAGAAGARIAGGGMSSLLVGVAPTDTAAFVAAIGALALAAAAACIAPARRAARTDPQRLLR